MKKIQIIVFVLISSVCFAQLDKDQFALDVNKADVANTEKLKAFIWKRYSSAIMDGAVKATAVTEFSFDQNGELQAKMISAETSEKQKPGIRGNAQQSAAEDKMDYFEEALKLSLAYTFMTKGQLLDFFGKATISSSNDTITAYAENVYVKGDKLTVLIDAKTNLYLQKRFSSLLGTDPVNGEIYYAKFASGVNHGSKTIINMPAQKMRVEAENKDYSQRVE